MVTSPIRLSVPQSERFLNSSNRLSRGTDRTQNGRKIFIAILEQRDLITRERDGICEGERGTEELDCVESMARSRHAVYVDDERSCESNPAPRDLQIHLAGVR
jgi:hypothetical protein